MNIQDVLARKIEKENERKEEKLKQPRFMSVSDPLKKLYAVIDVDNPERMLITQWEELGTDFRPTEKTPPFWYYFYCPNFLGLTREDGKVEVKIVKSEEETGLFLICYGTDSGLYLFNHKPDYKNGVLNLGYEIDNDLDLPLLVYIEEGIELGRTDDPKPVSLVRV